jgi:hypothetical protein
MEMSMRQRKAAVENMPWRLKIISHGSVDLSMLLRIVPLRSYNYFRVLPSWFALDRAVSVIQIATKFSLRRFKLAAFSVADAV